MKTFNTFYYEKNIDEGIIKNITTDLKRKFTKNLFSKTTLGIDLSKYQKNVFLLDESNFDQTKSRLQSEVVSVIGKIKKHKDDRLISNKKEFGKIYVKRVFEGEIDGGKELLEGNPISTIIYQLNNGGKIAFITTKVEDEEGYYKYIVCSNSAKKFFRDRLGTTLTQVGADSTERYKSKNKGSSFTDEVSIISKRIETPGQPTPITTIIPSKKIKTEYEIVKNYGIMDLSFKRFEEYKDQWGDGSKGIVGDSYKFKGKFKRENIKFGGFIGFKYSDSNKKETVYLLADKTQKLYYLVFDDKHSLDWTKKNEMIYVNVTSNSNDSNRITWRKLNLDELNLS